MRSDSVVPVGVYLSEGKVKRSIVGGEYSDAVEAEYHEGRIEIKVERFYRDDEAK